jgi:16S rRNA (uracil1498-N3)-methyltransferase
MIYIFDDNASQEILKIKGETFKYLFKVRRHNINDTILFRNEDTIEIAHYYEVVELDGRSATLALRKSIKEASQAKKELHLAWCVIDSKSIEKSLAMLNEIGVSQITFINCERSQKNFKLDFKRYERILHASMQQCGRTHKMAFDEVKSLKSFIEKNPQTVVFDFSDKVLDSSIEIDTILIGCEGGFSKSEKEMLSTQQQVRLDTPMILRSETAVVAVCSRVLF